MRIDVVTIFPSYFDVLDLSLLGRARRNGLLDLTGYDHRDFTHDRHRTVDDTPYGGGPGMLMRPEPWGEALDAVRAAGASASERPDVQRGVPLLLVPSPAGRRFTQRDAERWSEEPWVVFACARYEGLDARVTEDASSRYRVQEVSIGDYVLNGGEVAALTMIEAVVRLVPGVVGNAESLEEESHAAGTLEAPAYTKPASWRGREVPEVLLSGHHAEAAKWRRYESLRRTATVRPDLIAALDPERLAPADRAVLAELGWSVAGGRFRSTTEPVAD
jgi:tRNA (guanine37-N1)-methyltransferase